MAEPTWYAVCDKTTGILAGVGTVLADPLPPALEAIALPARPDFSVSFWNVATKAFVARPAIVWIDRLDDLIADPDFAAVWSSLNAAKRTQMRTACIRLIGGRRMRQSEESWIIDPPDAG